MRSSGYWASEFYCNKVLERPRVKNYLDSLMEQSKELNRKALLLKIEEGLGATETKFFSSDGRVTETRRVPDYAVRHEYLKLAFQLRGDLTPQEQASQINNIMMQISDATLQMVLAGKITPEDALREVMKNGNNPSPSIRQE